MVYRVKCLVKIHGEHLDSHAVGIVKELAHFMLNQDKGICTELPSLYAKSELLGLSSTIS